MLKIDRESLEIDSSGDEDMAEKLATAIESHIKEEAIELMTAAQTESNEFNKKVSELLPPVNHEIWVNKPDLIVEDQKKYSEFIKLRDFVYLGPSSLSDSLQWAKINNKSNDVVSLSDLTSTQDGQSILLRRVFNTPEYTVAHIKRDLRILQLRPPKKVQEVGSLQLQLKRLFDDSIKHVDECKRISFELKTQILENVTSNFTNLKNSIDSKVNYTTQSVHSSLDLLKKFLSQGIIVNDFGGRVVALAKEEQCYYNLNLLDYVKTWEPTRFEIASEEEFRTVENFSKLLNQENLFLPSSHLAQASKYNRNNIFEFDMARFEADIEKTKAAYESDLKTTKIECPFFAFSDEPKSCTISELEEGKIKYAARHSNAPIWFNLVDSAIRTIKSDLFVKYGLNRRLRGFKRCYP